MLKFMNDGVAAAMAWDAFDNLHLHDTAWAKSGLLKTDTLNRTYTPKRRYYAAKQVYKYVLPGFFRTEILLPPATGYDVYKTWHDPLKNMLFNAYVSENLDDFTIVGMSNVESDVELTIELKGLDNSINNKKVYYYRTSRYEDCTAVGSAKIINNQIKFTIPERSIFTFTTVH